MYKCQKKSLISKSSHIACSLSPQVVAVLAHELGHWKLGHTKTLFLSGQVMVLLDFALLAYVRNSASLYR